MPFVFSAVSTLHHACMQVQTLQSLGLSQEAYTVASQAIQAHPHSVPLWLLRLTLHSTGSGDPSLGELCKEAVEKIPKEVCISVEQ